MKTMRDSVKIKMLDACIDLEDAIKVATVTNYDKKQEIRETLDFIQDKFKIHKIDIDNYRSTKKV